MITFGHREIVTTLFAGVDSGSSYEMRGLYVGTYQSKHFVQLGNNRFALTAEELEAIEKRYDTSLNTRKKGPVLERFIYWATVAFAFYHLWTAGFGTPVDYVHMGVHLSGLFLFLSKQNHQIY